MIVLTSSAGRRDRAEGNGKREVIADAMDASKDVMVDAKMSGTVYVKGMVEVKDGREAAMSGGRCVRV